MRIFAVILLTLFVAQQHSKSIYLAYFLLNRDAIVKENCINKSRPEMQCDGKCHLKKTLKETTPEIETQQKSSNEELPRFQVKDISLFFTWFVTDFPEHFRVIFYPADKVVKTAAGLSHVPTPPPEL